MDWEKFAIQWGPAVPFMLILVKILFDAVYKILPRNLRAMRREWIEFRAVFLESHEEAMEALQKIAKRQKRCRKKEKEKKNDASPRRKLRRKLSATAAHKDRPCDTLKP